MEEDIDWWSKYYASTGDVEKSEQYLSLGYDKLQVRIAFILCLLIIDQCKHFAFYSKFYVLIRFSISHWRKLVSTQASMTSATLFL